MKIDPGLDFFGKSVCAGMTLDELTGFLAVVSDFLQRTAAHLDGKYVELGVDRSYEYAEAFRDILYGAVITSVVSFLEREAREFAHVLRTASSLPLTLSDLSGSWFERFRKYCDKLATIDLGFTDADAAARAHARCVRALRRMIGASGLDQAASDAPM